MRKLTDDTPTDQPIADPRDTATARVGTPTRDAAVDPQPGDFLPPTNAGDANPHGPDVVSPEIHAVKGKRVAPGKVSDKPAAQEVKETAQAVTTTTPAVTATDAQSTADAPEVPDSMMPAKNASADEWRAYAVAKGMDPTEADNAGRDDLVRRFT